MLNRIILMGRIVKDPELRTTTNGTPVATFTLAVERNYSLKGQEKITDFIDCVAWGKGGDFICQHFRKGSLIAVEGSLQSRKWEDRDGNKRTSWEVNVDHSYFTESQKKDGYQQMVDKQQEYKKPENPYGYDLYQGNEELPF